MPCDVLRPRAPGRAQAAQGSPQGCSVLSETIWLQRWVANGDNMQAAAAGDTVTVKGFLCPLNRLVVALEEVLFLTITCAGPAEVRVCSVRGSQVL